MKVGDLVIRNSNGMPGIIVELATVNASPAWIKCYIDGKVQEQWDSSHNYWATYKGN